jgi:hypothetical protein
MPADTIPDDQVDASNATLDDRPDLTPSLLPRNIFAPTCSCSVVSRC